MGITNEGKSTQDKVLDLCPSARDLNKELGERASDGDLVIICNGEHFIEVKKNTWNQTRPQKYITHVGYNTGIDQWFVIAPDDLLKMIAHRKGQHTKDPTVCVGFKPNHTEKWDKYRCTSNQLEQRIHAAIRQGERNTKMKNLARTLREDHDRTAERRRNMLHEAMEQ